MIGNVFSSGYTQRLRCIKKRKSFVICMNQINKPHFKKNQNDQDLCRHCVKFHLLCIQKRQNHSLVRSVEIFQKTDKIYGATHLEFLQKQSTKANYDFLRIYVVLKMEGNT